MKSDLKFNLPTEMVLDKKIQQFKEDEEKMQEMNFFVDNVLNDAEKEAQRQLDQKLVGLPFISRKVAQLYDYVLSIE